MKPDPQKLEAVNNYPVPVSKKEVRAFWGLQVITDNLCHILLP